VHGFLQVAARKCEEGETCSIIPSGAQACAEEMSACTLDGCGILHHADCSPLFCFLSELNRRRSGSAWSRA
jgi:hypothetical protein